MNGITLKCQTCGEVMGHVALLDKTLGVVCGDCAKGIKDGMEILKREGVSGVYLGACGDNEIPT